MRRLWAVGLVALAGCSVLFDPGKAAPKKCPGSAAQCPALPNATASCADAVCQYSCADHFVDANGDLSQASSDGCELDCTSGQPPENPAELVATVGAAAGEVDWSFPTSASAVPKYKLCVTPPGGAEVCVNVDPATRCAMGTCQQSTTGHVDNLRVTGRVVAVDTCGREGAAASAPAVSATPLDTSDPTKWTHDPGCVMSSYGAVGGQLSLEQTGDTCASSLVAGDEQWSDFTLDGDLKFGVVGNNIAGGMALFVNGSGYRMGALSAPDTAQNGQLSALTRRLPASNADVWVATSVHGASRTGTTHLRVISHQGVISWLEGPDASSLTELIRFPEGPRLGKLGIAAAGTGRVEVTNFRVTTTSALPPLGATSSSFDFASGGPPPGTHTLGSNLTYGACPAFSPGPTCDGGCLPNPGSMCAHVQRIVLDYTSLSFDLPTGVDVTAPWRLSLKVAMTPDAGNFAPNVLWTTSGGLLESAPFGNWTQPVAGLGQTYGTVLDPGLWHDAAWRFDPDGGRVDVTLDDTPVALGSQVFPPQNWSSFLGAFTLFHAGLEDAYVTDVQISQP